MASPVSDRDFRGYGSNPPAIRWPNDARLAVSVVVNVEEGAEFSIGQGDERNESVYEVVEEITGVRDLCMESHFEYGPRAGWPRTGRTGCARRRGPRSHGASSPGWPTRCCWCCWPPR